jgi:hypothetical protein
MRLPLGAWGASFVVLGCATASTLPPALSVAALKPRAAAELSCPEVYLSVAPLGDEKYAETGEPLYESVEGCSLSVVYVRTKDGYVLSKGARPKPSLEPDRVDVR